MYPQIRTPRVAPSTPGRRWWLALPALLLALGVLFFLRQPPPAAAPAAARAVPPLAPAKPETPSHVKDTTTKTMFTEAESRQKTPILRVTNDTPHQDTLTLASYSPACVYSLRIPPKATRELAVEPGGYRVRLHSSKKTRGDWTGRAVFKPFRHYITAYTLEETGKPLHFGE